MHLMHPFAPFVLSPHEDMRGVDIHWGASEQTRERVHKVRRSAAARINGSFRDLRRTRVIRASTNTCPQVGKLGGQGTPDTGHRTALRGRPRLASGPLTP